MTTLVLDASVIVKLFVQEAGSASAEALVRSDALLTAPDLVLLEITNALQRKARDGMAERDDVLAAIDRTERLLTTLHPIAPLVRKAASLALLLDHPVYDCAYLALAQQVEAPLVTADHRFAAAAQRAGHVDRIRLLPSDAT